MIEAGRGSAFPATVSRWLREPLLHFLGVGGALFIAYSALNPQSVERPQTNQIQMSEADLRQITLVWVAKWQRLPTQEELGSLIEEQVREEVLYREALALGLDQGDTVVRRRLAQKMEFLAEDISAMQDPDSAELRTWFENNGARFARPPRVSFRHIYFSPDHHGQQVRDVAASAYDSLASKPVDTPLADELGDRFMFQSYYGDRVPEQLTSVFGTQFTQEIFQLESGAWQGPVESGLGWHLVFVDSLTPGRVPIFEEVESEVKAAWFDEQRTAAKREMYAVMRARYEVLRPSAEAEAAAIADIVLP